MDSYSIGARRALLTAGLLSCLAASSCGSATRATRNEAVSACVTFGSCFPDDGINDCFEDLLHLFTVSEVKCLAAVGSDCQAAIRCFGGIAGISAVSQRGPKLPGCSSGVTCRCEGSILVAAGSSGELRIDCGANVEGRRCQSVPSDSGPRLTCASGNECYFHKRRETCSTQTTIDYCADGVLQMADCVQAGFQQCCGFGCCGPTTIPNP